MATEAVRDGSHPRGWDLALWLAQAALAALFVVTGAMRTFLSPEQLAAGHLTWAHSTNAWWLAVTGLGLMFAGLCLLLPPLIGLGERLVPATSSFMAMAMVITLASHIVRRTPVLVLGDLVVLALCVFVTWGRVYKIRY